MGDNSKIFLVGFMGSGKTTLGKKLAKKLGEPFFDLDQVIESSEKQSINQIFKQYGEASFRELETKVLKEVISSNESFVLSLGGGTPCNQLNMDLVNESGTSIYLKYNAGMLASRLIGAKAKRPLIKDLNAEQLQTFVADKLLEREPFYTQCKIVTENNKVKIEDLIRLV